MGVMSPKYHMTEFKAKCVRIVIIASVQMDAALSFCVSYSKLFELFANEAHF